MFKIRTNVTISMLYPWDIHTSKVGYPYLIYVLSMLYLWDIPGYFVRDEPRTYIDYRIVFHSWRDHL